MTYEELQVGRRWSDDGRLFQQRISRYATTVEAYGWPLRWRAYLYDRKGYLKAPQLAAGKSPGKSMIADCGHWHRSMATAVDCETKLYRRYVTGGAHASWDVS